jgi:hypothetical protein
MPIPINPASLIGAVHHLVCRRKSLPETFRDFVGAVVLSNLLSNDDDIFVTNDFLGEGVVESFAIGDQWHGAVWLKIVFVSSGALQMEKEFPTR